jgi:diguanylate cyclase (GGDEF)-like protein/PAS domain S-box-containing protein
MRLYRFRLAGQPNRPVKSARPRPDDYTMLQRADAPAAKRGIAPAARVIPAAAAMSEPHAHGPESHAAPPDEAVRSEVPPGLPALSETAAAHTEPESPASEASTPRASTTSHGPAIRQATLPPYEPFKRRRSDTAAGPRLQRVLADQANQPVASGLLHLDPVLVALADSERHFRALIEQAADGIVVVDAIGRITLANMRACHMTGYSPSEIVGLDLLETYPAEEREAGRRQLDQESGVALRFERMLLHRDGAATPIEVSVARLAGGERQLIMRDVTARQRAEAAQASEERRLRSLLRISEVECDSVPELLNRTIEEVVQFSDSAFGYIYAYDRLSGAFTLHSWARDARQVNEIEDPQWMYEIARSGIWEQVSTLRQPIVLNDLSSRPADSNDARQRPEGPAGDEEPAPVARFMTIPVISHDEVVAVVGVANKFEPYTEADASQLTQIMDVVCKIADRQQTDVELHHFAQQLETRVEERTREFEQANSQLEAANIEIAAANTELQKFLLEQERLQAELAYRALHDPLTGLPNRTMFHDRLDNAFRISERGVAVLWIDLDHFKEVNDIFGHEVGDEILVAVADRLRDVLRDTDDIARMGGDEFAVVLPNVTESEAQMVGDRVLAALVDKEGFRLKVGASVGVGWQRQTSGDGRVLIRRADQAMYRAKASGGGQAVMY